MSLKWRDGSGDHDGSELGGGGGIPTGLICMWSGLLSAIPNSWFLCDGTNGTPNLISCFIKGVATSATNPGTTGGASSHTPSGTVDTPALSWPAGVPTAANEASHTHGVTSNVSVADHASHTHSVTSNVSGTLTATGTVAWPVGVPTTSGIAATFAGNAVVAASTNSGTKLVTGNTSTGVSPVTTATGTVTMTSQGTVAWPAGVPAFSGTSNQAVTTTNNAVTSGNPSATLTHTVTSNAVTSGAGAAHTHTISWPAGVPTGTAPAFSGASQNTEPVFYSLAFIMKG